MTVPDGAGRDHRSGPRRGAGIVVRAGLAVVGLLVMAWAVFGPIRDRPTPGDFGASSGPAPAHPLAGASTSAVPGNPARPAAAPVTLVVPVIGVQAPVRPVDTVDGSLAVPDDPGQVGWWVGGAVPGSVTGTWSYTATSIRSPGRAHCSG